MAHRRAPVLLAGIVAVLSACAAGTTTARTPWTPRVRRDKIDNLFIPILFVAIIIGVLVVRRHGLRRNPVPAP